jgi:hypothetical protein
VDYENPARHVDRIERMKRFVKEKLVLEEKMPGMLGTSCRAVLGSLALVGRAASARLTGFAG